MKTIKAPFSPRQYHFVISKGEVMEYIGIGYIAIRKATEDDYENIPVLTN